MRNASLTNRNDQIVQRLSLVGIDLYVDELRQCTVEATLDSAGDVGQLPSWLRTLAYLQFYRLLNSWPADFDPTVRARVCDVVEVLPAA